jgi:hypothetical protein
MKVAWDFAINVNFFNNYYPVQMYAARKALKIQQGNGSGLFCFITGKKPRSVELTSRHEKE